MWAPDGLARGVSYIDKKTRNEVDGTRQDRGAGRELLRDGAHHAQFQEQPVPDGIANSSGLVGQLSDGYGGSAVGGYLPILEDLPPQNEDGVGGMHMYMPWWLYKEQKAGQDAVRARLSYRNRRRARQPGAGDFGGSQRFSAAATASELKRNLRKLYGANIYFAGRGEMIPNEDSYCEIDPERGGPVGHPGAALPFQMEPGRNPAGQAHAGDLPGDHHAGGRQGHCKSRRGQRIGVSRAAARSSTKWAPRKHGRQSEDFGAESILPGLGLKNLFITDAAPFVSNADKNPTLTITALGWRTSEYIADQVKKLNVKV